MKLATTTCDFGRWQAPAEEQIKRLFRAGFRYIDLSLYTHRDNEEFMCDGWREHARELRKRAEDMGMRFVQAHSIGFNPIGERDEAWKRAFDETVRSIEVCGELGIESTAVHSGVMKGIGKEEYFEKNAAFYRMLLPVCEKTGVNVLIENSTKANMGDCYFFFTGKDMAEFIEYVGHPLLNAVWDTGHANVEGPQYQEILAVAPYLKAIHFNDNNGKKDEHLAPYLGTLDIDEVMHALIDSRFKGPFTLESGSSFKTVGGFPIKRNVYCEDDRAKNAPLALQEQMEKVLFEIGKHILTAYDLYEE